MNQPNTITILAADLVSTRAAQLLDKLAYAGDWEPAQKLKEALACYSECRLGVAMAEGASEVLAACNEKAPATQRNGET